MRWLYGVLYALAWVCVVPWRRRGLWKRFATGDGAKGPVVWLHAVSVGETKALLPIVEWLRATCRCTIVVSSVTATGHEIARKLLSGADAWIYLPWDFGWLIRRTIARWHPALVIVSEHDLWYRFLWQARKAGAAVAVVNGTLSERSWRRFARVRWAARALFGLVDCWAVQGDVDRQRLVGLGVDEATVCVTGNLKSDVVEALGEEELAALRRKAGVVPGDLVLVIGSTHAPEEEWLLRQLLPLLARHPQLKVLLVPRHPERFDEVWGLLQQSGVPCGRWSQGGGGRIVLVDAMGVLARCYRMADMAIVAGSYSPHVGGHNIVEALCCGIPVIVGPHMPSQASVVSVALEHQAVLQGPTEAVGDVVEQLIVDPVLRQQFGARSLECAKALRGATVKTTQMLQELCLSKKVLLQ